MRERTWANTSWHLTRASELEDNRLPTKMSVPFLLSKRKLVQYSTESTEELAARNVIDEELEINKKCSVHPNLKMSLANKALNKAQSSKTM